MKSSMTNMLWSEGEDQSFGKVAVEYAAGEDVVLDRQFVQYECQVNQAHVVMLHKQGLISKVIAYKLLQGLIEIQKLDEKGNFKLKKELEDVHSNVEQYLIEKYGIKIGGYLRLGIARNDQVFTDTRMWMRQHILFVSEQLIELIQGLTNEAMKYTQTVMPGYTHLRISQPITYAHWLTAKAYHFLDDLNNLLHVYDLVNVCPLGIFEMAGTHLPIDRNLTALLLGFNGVTPHSLYTANQRGELELKLLSDLSLLALHISRSMNEVIIFSTHEFQLLYINDLYTTGGTAQPNLKNPDTLEVVRANMAKFSTSWMENYMIMNTLPSGFNRDTQQTKPILFDTVALMEKTLPVFIGIMTSLTPNKGQMEKVANLNFSLAPDVSNQIVVKGGVSFREAYKIVKTLIKDGSLKESFTELTTELVASVSQKVLGKTVTVSRNDIQSIHTATHSAFAHTSLGGSAPSEVKKQIVLLSNNVNKIKAAIVYKQKNIHSAYKKLNHHVNKLLKKQF